MACHAFFAPLCIESDDVATYDLWCSAIKTSVSVVPLSRVPVSLNVSKEVSKL